MDANLSAVAARLRTAARITALTGAGISAASGVPTFRGPLGLWKSFRPEDLATPQAFLRDPQLVWEWYDWRRSLIAKCDPNAAHEVLALWSRREGFTLITQNVDGLHERAGTRNIIRYHGSIWRMRCAAGCGAPEWEDLQVPLSPLPPRCPSCGGLARPGVVWFGEAIPKEAARAAQAATTCELFLSIGTSSIVYPAAGLLDKARARGAYTVEVNPEPTASGESVDLVIELPAEEALPLIERG